VVAALDRIVRDEPRHAALGWETLDWLLASPHADEVHAYVTRRLPGWIAQLRRAYAGEAPLPHLTSLTEADRAWGTARADRVRAACDATVERDWLPRLAKRGLA